MSINFLCTLIACILAAFAAFGLGFHSVVLFPLAFAVYCLGQLIPGSIGPVVVVKQP